MFRSLLAALAIIGVFSTQALAHEVTVGQLTLTDLWTRATPPNAPTGAAYLTITNTGDVADRLIGVATPAAAKGEIHEMKVDGGVMTMRPVEGGLEIPAHGSVTLAPGGFHLMFMGLKSPFVEGGKLPVTLTFATAGSVDTFFHIMAIGAKGPGSQGGQTEMKMDMKQ